MCTEEIEGPVISADGHSICEMCEAKVFDYQQKVERRLERLQASAARARDESAAGWKRGSEMAERIPFGQPILVGHHSEKRDRNYRARIDGTFRRAYERGKEAEVKERRAQAAAANAAVSSDDPAAILKLRDRVAGLEADQAEMIRLNAAIAKLIKKPRVSKSQRDEERVNVHKGTMDEINARFRAKKAAEDKVTAGYIDLAPKLAEDAKISLALAQKLLTPDFIGRIGIPSYSLTNNAANIRRIKERIASLLKSAADAAVRPNDEQEYSGGITVKHNRDDNRVQVFFPGKPPESTRQIMKHKGFNWSPSVGAWQRQLTTNGEYSAMEALVQIGAWPISIDRTLATLYNIGGYGSCGYEVIKGGRQVYHCLSFRSYARNFADVVAWAEVNTPQIDYDWREDRNLYDHTPGYLCSACGEAIEEDIPISGPQGSHMHYGCCMARIDTKLAAEKAPQEYTSDTTDWPAFSPLLPAIGYTAQTDSGNAKFYGTEVWANFLMGDGNQFYSRDRYEIAYEERTWDRLRLLPSSQKCHVAGEMDLPLHATRDEAYIAANRIAEACGNLARQIGGSQLRLTVDSHRYLLTYDNAAKKLVTVQRLD